MTTKKTTAKVVPSAESVLSATPRLQTAGETSLKLIIAGRGQAAGRVPTLVRLRPEITENLKQVADGPLYLLIEMALQHWVQHLKDQPPGLQVVQAADLS